ncbi:MAG: tetratricopeptide repeat protein [Clostridiales bacterium]|nr:tetratricopeptide repeat protein [Clostridiales bacterium]
MDTARFEEGKQAYAAKEYRAAAKAFIAAADRGDGNGAAYHMAGNSLVRLRRFGDAVTVYRHALIDEVYDKRAAVHVNLGMALTELGEYAEAITSYQAAIDDPAYTGVHRALQGKAAALCEMGEIEHAAIAYRQAALDSENPDPGKALNNLGLCFMAMRRPGDAVEAYRAALGFDTYEARGKTLANLGQAYHALGRHEEAVRAFEKATGLHNYSLSASAALEFEKSAHALTPGRRETVEGWSTGEMSPLLEETIEPVGPSDGPLMPTPPAIRMGDQEEVSSFFAMTDDEMRERDRAARRMERDARRAERNPWALVGVIVAVVAIVGGGIAAAFALGLGYPTQRMTVTAMLEARAAGQPVAQYWVAVPTSDVDKEMAKLPPMKEFALGDVERSPRTSTVTVTVTPESGAPLYYQVTLVREGVGWKVNGVDNDWRSTGGGS